MNKDLRITKREIILNKSKKMTSKSLRELIPEDFTMEHDRLVMKLKRENREKYDEVHDLACDLLDGDRDFCEEHGISYNNQTKGDLYRVLYAFAVQRNYIEQTPTPSSKSA